MATARKRSTPARPSALVRAEHGGAPARLAASERIGNQAWRGLDAGRKELLLPLKSSDALREGAQHISKFNLTRAKARESVTGALESQGKSRLRRAGNG